jgi:curved DNA-binding protein CbpA
MIAFDPYNLLGIARSANGQAIKTAYRQRVQTAHPDRGGDPEIFIAVARAFSLLSDPEARRLYDETGIVDENALETLRKDVAVILADMFDAAVATAIATGIGLDRVDFIAQMRGAVDTGLAEARLADIRSERDISALDGLRKRVRRHEDGRNLFVDRLETQIAAKQAAGQIVRRRIVMLEMAKTELGNYGSEVELIAALEGTR